MSLVGSKVLVEGGGNKKWCKKIWGGENMGGQFLFSQQVFLENKKFLFSQQVFLENKKCRPAMFNERGVL